MLNFKMFGTTLNIKFLEIRSTKVSTKITKQRGTNDPNLDFPEQEQEMSPNERTTKFDPTKLIPSNLIGHATPI